MSVRPLSVNFLSFIGEKRRKVMFLTYAYTFHLLFNFPNEFLMKYYPYVVDKKKKTETEGN